MTLIKGGISAITQTDLDPVQTKHVFERFTLGECLCVRVVFTEREFLGVPRRVIMIIIIVIVMIVMIILILIIIMIEVVIAIVIVIILIIIINN